MMLNDGQSSMVVSLLQTNDMNISICFQLLNIFIVVLKDIEKQHGGFDNDAPEFHAIWLEDLKLSLNSLPV